MVEARKRLGFSRTKRDKFTQELSLVLLTTTQLGKRNRKILADPTSQLLAQANVTVEDRIGSCLGMAGLARPADWEVIERICSEIGFHRNCILAHDAQIALVG